jgi:energy-coupling factor transport system ATP-binding protein
MNAIQFEDVCFSYGEGAFSLNNINLTIEEGEFVAVLGHNGSGKSTLARLCNGLLKPSAGRIAVFGKSAEEDEFEVRKNVGVVFQNPDNQMVASIVEDDVAFGPENIAVPREEIGERIDFALKAVGMEKYRHATPSRLSGGQKQRIAVAGVLAIKPKVLILDESTAMLDPRGRREITDVVKRLNKEEKITVLMITHFMDEALMADRAIVMNKGEIVMRGTPKEIFERYDELEIYNLTLPTVGYICKKLQAKGIPVQDCLQEEELAKEIKRCASRQNI